MEDSRRPLLYTSTACAVCRQPVVDPPFLYGGRCDCIYHEGCLATRNKCITHRGSQLEAVATTKCLLSGCQSLTTDVICRSSKDQILTRMLKCIGNAGGSLSVSNLFVEVFGIVTLWPESINAVDVRAVNSAGAFKRRQHPVVALAWPILWQHIRSSADVVVIAGVVWLTWRWVEHSLGDLLPRFIPYTEIAALVPHMDAQRVAAFRKVVTMGRTVLFKGITSAGIHCVTKLGCYDYRQTAERIHAADYRGVAIDDLLTENAEMMKFIQKLEDDEEVMVFKRRVYSLRHIPKCTALLEAVWEAS